MFAGFNELMKRQEPEFRGAQVGALKVCEKPRREEREREKRRRRKRKRRWKSRGGGEGAEVVVFLPLFFSLFLVLFFQNFGRVMGELGKIFDARELSTIIRCVFFHFQFGVGSLGVFVPR